MKIFVPLHSQTSEDNDLTNEHNVDEPDILMCEVKQAIKRLRNGKSPGIDNIQTELLKESDTEGIKIIHRLCNKI